MKSKYSKAISVGQFQAPQIADLKSYQKKIEKRAKDYLEKSNNLRKNCPICNSPKFKPFLQLYGYFYLQCQECSHVSLKYFLSDSDLLTFYTTSIEYAATYVNKDQLNYRLEQIARPKIKFVMESIKRGKGSWLDIGSAVGDVLKAVGEYKGWTATGLELSSESVAVGKKLWKVNLLEEQLSTYYSTAPQESYDVVSAFGYFGLVTSPLNELTMAANLVKPNGYLVVGDTNADSVSSALQRSYPELSMRHLIPPNTISSFTEKSLLFALMKLEFTPIAIWRFGLDFFEVLKYFSLLKPGFQQTPIFEYLSNHANVFQAGIDKDNKADYMIVIAKKGK